MVLKSNDKFKHRLHYIKGDTFVWRNGMNEQPDQDTSASFAEMLAEHETMAPRLQAGQKVTGTVIAVSGDSVFVDVGVKQDGVLDRAEILDADGHETVGQGDAVTAWITGISPNGIRLSRSMSGSGVAALEDARDTGIPVDGRVRGQCKGGYEVEVMGKAAFCPGSQMEPVEDPATLAGRQMQFLITKIENHGRNIVVSRRALLERERRENLDKLLASLNVGDTTEGVVTRLVPYGAFVELAPGVEGLVHISELSWSRVGSPDEAVSAGERVRAKVMSIVKDEKGQMRIGLSVKQAQDDPWGDLQFAAGDIVEGTVRRLAPFGAFVEIAPGVEGMAHISELSWERRIARPDEILAPGDVVSVKIKDISPENRRIALSLKDAQGDPWQDAHETYAPGVKVSGIVESRSQHGIFVRLSPGITGLLPQGAVNRSAAALSKIGQGDKLEVVVRSIDPATRRISLAPVTAETEDAPAEDKSWKQHPAFRHEGGDLGIMAQAMKKAFEKS